MTVETAPQTEKPPRRRHWIPLALKVFVALLVIAGTLGGILVGLPGWRNWKAIREIERVGGAFDSKPRGPEFLRNLAGDKWMIPFDEITAVHLNGSRIDDAGLIRLSGLKNLILLK